MLVVPFDVFAGAKRIAWTAQIKALGVRGHGSEDGFLCMALNTHFGCNGPEGWHLETKRERKTSWVADLQRENRVHKLPGWVQYYLQDLICSQQMRICKPLPYPEEFLLDKAGASHWRRQSLIAKRKHLENVAAEKLEPKSLHIELWSMMKVSRQSLPTVVRPGDRPR